MTKVTKTKLSKIVKKEEGIEEVKLSETDLLRLSLLNEQLAHAQTLAQTREKNLRDGIAAVAMAHSRNNEFEIVGIDIGTGVVRRKRIKHQVKETPPGPKPAPKAPGPRPVG